MSACKWFTYGVIALHLPSCSQLLRHKKTALPLQKQGEQTVSQAEYDALLKKYQTLQNEVIELRAAQKGKRPRGH